MKATEDSTEMTHMIEELFVEVGRHQLEEVRVEQGEHLVPRGLVHEGVVHAVHRQRGSVAVAAMSRSVIIRPTIV